MSFTNEDRKLMNDCFRMLHKHMLTMVPDGPGSTCTELKFEIERDGHINLYVNTSTGEQEWDRGTIRPPTDDSPAGLFEQHLPGYERGDQ